jgi:hypothetical protein
VEALCCCWYLVPAIKRLGRVSLVFYMKTLGFVDPSPHKAKLLDFSSLLLLILSFAFSV